MKLDTPFKIVPLTPSAELMNFDFSTISEEEWNKNQMVKLVHFFKELQVFPIMGLPRECWSNPKAHEPIMKNTDHPIHNLIMAELKKMEEHLNAKAKIAVLDGLAPGTKIYRHYDESNLYELCHRIHLPIITDPAVKFFIDDKEHYFKAGEFFEFDNRRYHEVHNDSAIFRIHLVVDLLPNNL
jgi:hypothetical protein